MDELRAVLELATDEELQQLTQLLFSRKFNPLDYLQTPHPIDVQSRDRSTWIDSLEQRFKYLAADGVTVLQGKTEQVSYRQVLIKICRYLKINYSQKLSTTELEAEIFLHLLGRTCQQLPATEQQNLLKKVQRSLAQKNLPEPLPLSIQKNPLNLLLKGSSAIAVSAILKPIILRELANQFALHFAKYQVTTEAIKLGSTVAANQLQNYATVKMAQRSMVVSATRYGAMRSVFGVLGPVLWTWFLADLGWRAIATNYGRIIPTVFALAQIRLTRSECWEFA